MSEKHPSPSRKFPKIDVFGRPRPRPGPGRPRPLTSYTNLKNCRPRPHPARRSGRPHPPTSHENQKFAALGRPRPRPIPSPGSPRPRTSSRTAGTSRPANPCSDPKIFPCSNFTRNYVCIPKFIFEFSITTDLQQNWNL